MSLLLVSSYKLVTRDYLEEKILNRKPRNCKQYIRLRTIKRELRRNRFYNTNKECGWWRIFEDCGNIRVVPQQSS